MIAEPASFKEFVVARSPALLRTAWMLTGDAASTEDLLQSALARVWPRWSRIADGRPEAYVRTAMVRINASWRSRRWNGETPTADMTRHESGGGVPDAHAQVDDRMVLAAALAALPVRQRQAVVLRFFDDLSVEEVAEIMGSSPGTVKSQSSRGLAKLRAALATADPNRLEHR